MHLQQANTSDWLSSSWHRSTEAGLKQRRLPEDIRLPQSILTQRRHQYSSLIQIVERNAQPLEHLRLALQCGGSDAFSGISGNPLASWVARELIRGGGGANLAETDELIGAEP